jgi:hypothetical protein
LPASVGTGARWQYRQASGCNTAPDWLQKQK